jgi:hypothetical protein
VVKIMNKVQLNQLIWVRSSCADTHRIESCSGHRPNSVYCFQMYKSQMLRYICRMSSSLILPVRPMVCRTIFFIRNGQVWRVLPYVTTHRKVARLSQRRPGFKPVSVGFVVGKVALGQVLLLVIRFSLISIIPPWLSKLTYLRYEQEARWWPQFADIASSHRYEQQDGSSWYEIHISTRLTILTETLYIKLNATR